MDILEGTAWSVLPSWGSEGWNAGVWPYIIFAVARTLTGTGNCSAKYEALEPAYTLITEAQRNAAAVVRSSAAQGPLSWGNTVP